MNIIADLHIHSRYSRACSQDLMPGNIAVWADRKGLGVIGSGDFTHPGWLADLKGALAEKAPGLYGLRDNSAKALFLLSAEISSIYKQGDKVRRVHNLVLAPDFQAVDRIIRSMERLGANLKSDGRPITGIKCPDLVKLVKDSDSRCAIVPAHVWTPHFGVFGSLSGFDSIEEAFGEEAENIFALETGLSSDPKMNWQISSLDRFPLISNSDAHSLRKIGREANVFDVPQVELSFAALLSRIAAKDPKEFLYTIEFFPEEGKYHLDGHADCRFSCLPSETAKLKETCPKCGKKLLVGVLNRVGSLGDREYGYAQDGAVPFRSLVPLEEIIAETYGVGAGSKKVASTYMGMTDIRPEFEILLNSTKEEISGLSDVAVAESVMRVREGKLHIEGGYDGVFGKIKIYTDEERERLLRKAKQESLF
ncbi:MAG: endonuclease Q family protein [Candidatus Saccharibacteria bacterium]